MKGRRFYTVPFDARNDPTMKLIRHKCGGIVAFGRWQALLGILYDQGGLVDLSDRDMEKVVARELELPKANQLDRFISVLVEVGWIERVPWREFRHVVSKSVTDQLAYKAEQAERAAKRGHGEARPNSGEGDDG